MANIDELVATHVMGWRKEDGEWYEYQGDVRYNVSYQARRFHPAIDMNDAWKVVNKCISYGFGVNVLGGLSGFNCEIYEFISMTTVADVDNETAPLAICKAALMARGVNVDGN